MLKWQSSKKAPLNTSAQDLDTVAVLCRPYQTLHQSTLMTVETCLGCRARTHRGGGRQCLVYNQAYSHCHKLRHLARVCRGRQIQPRYGTTTSTWQLSANTIRVQSQPDNTPRQLQLYNMTDSKYIVLDNISKFNHIMILKYRVMLHNNIANYVV